MARKLHICFGGHEFPPLGMPFKAGTSALFLYLLECLNEMVKDEHTLSVVTTHRPKYYQNIIEKHGKFNRKTFREVIIHSTRNPYIASFHLYRHLAALNEQLSINILHILMKDVKILPLICKLTPKTRNMKIVAHVYMPFVVTLMKDFIDVFTATSNLLRNYLLRQNVDKDKIFIVPPPINHNLFKPNVCKKGCDVGCVRGLYIGSLSQERFPISNLLLALKLLKDDGVNFKFKIVARDTTDFSKIDVINRIARRSGLIENVETQFKLLSIEEKVKLFNSVDFVLFPYTSFVAIDPPITLLEVMSCGRIVISTKVQSIPEIIKDGFNGFLMSSPNTSQLYIALQRFLSAKDNGVIRKNARNTILEKFSYPKVAEKIANIYSKLNEL